jgi:hypothetical protein
MASWTNDGRLHGLMRAYLAAVARLDTAREQASPPEVIDRLVNEKRIAAQAYEEALVARGWQIPGLAIGPMARAGKQLAQGALSYTKTTAAIGCRAWTGGYSAWRTSTASPAPSTANAGSHPTK